MHLTLYVSKTLEVAQQNFACIQKMLTQHLEKYFALMLLLSYNILNYDVCYEMPKISRLLKMKIKDKQIIKNNTMHKSMP